MRLDPNQIEQARRWYTDGLTGTEIADKLGCSQRSVRNWAARFSWDRYSSPEQKIEARIAHLLEQDGQSEADLREIDRLTENLAKLRKAGGARAQRVKAERKAANGATPDERSWLFAYQRKFTEDRALLRIVKKSRQIGWTLLIAAEMLEGALKRGVNQGYMSASFDQTEQCNDYVKQIGFNRYGVKLKGRKAIHLPNGTKIRFFAANPATAQGFNGDMYFDEFAWLMRAKACFENAAAQATLRDYRITICSTPSVYTHYFEELWDESRSPIKASRHLVTVVDAINQGNPLINLQKILDLFPPRAIRRLYMCETLDDQGSAFTFDEVMACVKDEEGRFDYKPGETIRGGLDVSRMRDDTSCAFLSVKGAGGKPTFSFRHIRRFTRVSLTTQEEALKNLLTEWAPEQFWVDGTTIGEHMVDALSEDFSCVEGLRFTPTSKAMLVINMQNLVREKRIELPFEQRIIDSFLAIKQKPLETMVGYEADGNEDIGHADDFWALALACYSDTLGAAGGGYFVI